MCEKYLERVVCIIKSNISTPSTNARLTSVGIGNAVFDVVVLHVVDRFLLAKPRSFNNTFVFQPLQ